MLTFVPRWDAECVSHFPRVLLLLTDGVARALYYVEHREGRSWVWGDEAPAETLHSDALSV